MENSCEYAVREILHGVGEDVGREGLLETPKRYVSMLKEFFDVPAFNFTVFEKETDEMVVIKSIPFYSFCEHHLLPFFGTAAIAYIPHGKQVGLSKLPRVLEMFSRRLQNQERIGQQVADYLNDKLSKDVAIVITARHMCMEMRGVKKAGAETITSTLRGRFKEDVNTRQEFLNLIR